MDISSRQLSELGTNLGQSFIENQEIKNCWHFYTDGKATDAMFYDEEDFRDGMNRIYNLSYRYQIIILAFVLMDTHVHFVLLGTYEQCYGFMQEYLRLTSRHILHRHQERSKLRQVAISCQQIGTDTYLKTVICYVIKNPVTAGLPVTAATYPWSSGALYFAGGKSWATASWTNEIDKCPRAGEIGLRDYRAMFHTRDKAPVAGLSSQSTSTHVPEQRAAARVIDGLFFPGDYVAYQMVEKLYRSAKSFHYFMSLNKDTEIEAQVSISAGISLPMQEMRQHRDDLCKELYGHKDLKELDTTDRIRLANALRRKFNCSKKQVIRLCGLKVDETEDLIK